MNKKLVFLGRGGLNAFLVSLLVVACTKSPDTFEPIGRPISEHEEHKGTELIRDKGRLGDFTDADDKNLDVLAYHLKGDFDWKKRSLSASVRVKFQFKETGSSVLHLESEVAKVVSVKSAEGATLSFTVERDRLAIALGKKVEANTASEVTIEYLVSANLQAGGEQSALTAVAPRLGDPIRSRVYYTTSEPLGASEWMPCHNVPRDRAQFSAEFVMPADEKLIANGDLVADEVSDGIRRMAYATQYTIPTYLMAFGVGQFDSAVEMHGNLPVGFWYRKGLKGDYAGMAKKTLAMIKHYESLLVPYPFEKYMTVLLPEFPAGGIEHAGITFQAEHRSNEPMLSPDLGLTAHELGHQWFGDYVTIAEWDDLWIKEGMATLLAEEAGRYMEDQNKTGRLFGRNFDVAQGDAIRDPELAPDNKYTSGPYGRSAWLFTQIRAEVGETKFWGTLAGVLKDHAFGTISTDQMIEAFRPSLGDLGANAVRKALSAKKLPRLEIAAAEGKSVTLSVEDPEQAMIRALELSFVKTNGEARSEKLPVGNTKLISKGNDELVVIDSHDVQALGSFHVDPTQFSANLLPLVTPMNADERALFLKLPGSAQVLALTQSALWKFGPKEAQSLVSALSSEEAKYFAFRVMCEVAKRDPEAKDAWKEAVTASFTTPPFLGLANRPPGRGLTACTPFVATPGVTKVREAILNNPESVAHREAEILLLGYLDHDTDIALKIWGNLARRGESIRTRTIGLSILAKHLDKNSGYSYPGELMFPEFKSLVLQLLKETESFEMLGILLPVVQSLDDKAALPGLSSAARMSPRARIQVSSVCLAYNLAKGDLEAWTGFVNSFGDLKQWNPLLKSALENPAQRCR